MPATESDPLVVAPSNNGNNNNDEEAQPPPPPSRRTRRKGSIPPLLIGILASLCIAAITAGVLVVWNAEKRKRAPKQLWINTLLMNSENNTTTFIQPGCEVTILIMRHCEKYGPLVESRKSQHCSYLGLQRAHFMTSLFGSNNNNNAKENSSKLGTTTTTTSTSSRWPNPSYLYALSPDRGGHDNYRQMETLTPIATKVGLKLNHDYMEGQEVSLAQDVFEKMATGDACGKVVLISWTHRSIPQLAAALGCGRFNQDSGGCPAYYPVDSFDDVWMLKYVYEPASMILSKKKQSNHPQLKHMWVMYPTITKMNFDPLAYSHAVGDYPDGGKPQGGSWLKEL